MPKVIVEARPQGFWSAGKFWPGGKTEAEVTGKQLAELEAEPAHFLVARVVEQSAPAVQPQPQQSQPQPQQQKRK